MSFCIYKTKIYISFFFCAGLLLFTLIDKSGLVLPVLLASLLHEIGHIFALYIVKNPPSEINFIVGGIEIKTNAAKNNIFVSLCGPLLNILLFLVFYNTNLNFSAINLLLGSFNLLPFCGLDGASIICEIFKNSEKTQKFITVLTILFSIFLFVTAVFVKTADNKISFVLLSLYFMLFTLLKYS